MRIRRNREQWRWVPGYEGYYEVSDRGRVRSYCISGSRSGSTKEVPHILTPRRSGADRSKYLQVYLRGRKYRAIHLLVLEAFVGPRPEGMQGCHNNGTTTCNELHNLRWGTRESNIADQIAHGRTKGEKHWNAKISDAQAEDIRRRITLGEKQKDLAAEYGISRPQVCAIWKGEKR